MGDEGKRYLIIIIVANQPSTEDQPVFMSLQECALIRRHVTADLQNAMQTYVFAVMRFIVRLLRVRGNGQTLTGGGRGSYTHVHRHGIIVYQR